jgi:hypothetical protein
MKSSIRPVERHPLSDAAVYAHKQLKSNPAFGELLRALEAQSPGITLLTQDGTADITTTALTAAQHRGYELAIANLINLTD